MHVFVSHIVFCLWQVISSIFGVSRNLCIIQILKKSLNFDSEYQAVHSLSI